jgi:hypothetical protein
MKCAEFREFYDDYILHELEPEIEMQINEHLLDCDQCRKEISEREKIIDLFRKSQKFSPPVTLYRRISDGLGVVHKEKKPLFVLPKGLVYAAAAFVLGVVMTRAIDTLFLRVEQVSPVEVKQEQLRPMPFSDTVEFYSVPAKNLARI